MLPRVLLVALLGFLAALSLAAPLPAGGISYNSVSLLNDDSYNKTSLDVHDETETTTKLTIIDADNTDVDLSQEFTSGEVTGDSTTSLLGSLGIDDDNIRIISLEISNKTSHDLDYDNESYTDKDVLEATALDSLEDEEEEEEEAKGGGLFLPFSRAGEGRYRYPAYYEDPDYSPRRCYFA